MGNLIVHVLEVSIMASYLILAVLFIRACYRKMSASFKCVLWLLVGVRLLIPVTISTPFGLVPQVELAQEENTQRQDNLKELQNAGAQQSNAGIAGVQSDGTHWSDAQYQGAEGNNDWKYEDDVYADRWAGRHQGMGVPGVTGANVGIVGGSTGNVQDAGISQVENGSAIGEEVFLTEGTLRVLAICWIFGIVCLLVYMFVGWLRLHRSLGTAVPETVEFAGKQIHIYRTENVGAPFLLGMISPKIYLPFGLTGKEMEYVLAHELMHIRRKDYIVKPLSFVVLALYWFHPLVWVTYILLGRDIELACDEQVLRENSALDRVGYARALLSCNSEQRKFYVCPVAFGESNVKVRVKNVLDYKKPGFWVMLVCVILCVAVALMFMTVSEDSGESGKDGTVESVAMPTEGPTAEPIATPTTEPTAEPTTTPTAEPTATPTAVPTATPDPNVTPVPTVVPGDYEPAPLPGYTEAQSKQIREELAGRIKYRIKDKTDMLMWLDTEEYVHENSLGSIYLNRLLGMKIVGLDVTNYIEALEMDGQKWLAVNMIPHVEQAGVTFVYAERAEHVMIPVNIREDGSVELGNYEQRLYWADHADRMPDVFAEENYIRTRIHLMQADVTHDGIMDNIETLIYLPPEADLTLNIDTLVAQLIGVQGVYVQVYDGSTATEESLGTPIFCGDYSTCHAGNGALSVVHRDGKDYLLSSSTWEGQGAVDYSFDVLALDGEGHWYLIDQEEFHWDGERNEGDTQESLKQHIATFKDRLAPWIENGEIAAATELDYYFITTESHPYEAHQFYDRRLR